MTTTFEPASLTDTGNGQGFVAQFHEAVRYVHGWRQWIVWDGTRWKPDAIELAMELAKITARSIYQEIAEGAQSYGWTPDECKAAATWARQSLNTHARGHVESRPVRPAVAITPDMLDTHIYLLPCTNGTLDLRTFELREADPADYMTKSTGIAFDPGARLSPASEAFLTQITCGDEDLSEYIQKALGYALTGDAEAVRPWMREYRELARSRGIGADVSENRAGTCWRSRCRLPPPSRKPSTSWMPPGTSSMRRRWQPLSAPRPRAPLSNTFEVGGALSKARTPRSHDHR